MAGESILIIDDNPANLKLARLLLETEGYSVRTAMDAEEALASIKALRPDCMLEFQYLSVRPEPEGLRLSFHTV